MVLDAGVVPAQGAAIQEIGLAKLHWDAVQQHQLLSAVILRTGFAAIISSCPMNRPPSNGFALRHSYKRHRRQRPTDKPPKKVT